MASEAGSMAGWAPMGEFQTLLGAKNLAAPGAGGTPLGRVYDLYGDVLAQVDAPEDGVVFGLRYRPAVLEGEWCCFYGIIEAVRDDLLGSGG